MPIDSKELAGLVKLHHPKTLGAGQRKYCPTCWHRWPCDAGVLIGYVMEEKIKNARLRWQAS